MCPRGWRKPPGCIEKHRSNYSLRRGAALITGESTRGHDSSPGCESLADRSREALLIQKYTRNTNQRDDGMAQDKLRVDLFRPDFLRKVQENLLFV